MQQSSKESRDEFFRSLRRALGKGQSPSPVEAAQASALSQDDASVMARAALIEADALQRADALAEQAQQAAAQAGWRVASVSSEEQAAAYILDLARGLEARSIVRSAHAALDRLGLESKLSALGVRLTLMAASGLPGPSREQQRQALRQTALAADVGITGVDYLIAETGSCVLIPRAGVSRLVSLLPPVHVAVVERGRVLPSLDELFTLRRRDFLRGNLGSYMNLISGPSRSADIEYTLVTGVHGPGEVHLVFIA